MSELPQGWASALLAEVADINPRLGIRPNEEAPVSFVGMADLDADQASSGPGTTRPYGDVSKGYTYFRTEDILVARITPCFQNNKIGQADITHEHGAGSTEFHVVRPHPSQLDERYLLHFLRRQEILQAGESMMTGSGGQRRVPPHFLRNLRVPLPPLPEQRRIAAILDKATVLTANASGYGALVRSLWETTFNSHYAALSDVEPIALDQCSVIGSGITKGRKVPTSSELHDTPYLTVANVQDGYLALDEVKTIGVTEAEQEKYRLEHGDVLLTEGGDPDKLGRGTIWRNEVPGAINQNHVFRVRPNVDQVDPAYLALALRTPESRAYFLRQAKQTTGIATINKTQLRRTPVYLPSLDVQRHIVHRCAAVASAEASNNRRAEAARSLVTALQSRAFRGEL